VPEVFLLSAEPSGTDRRGPQQNSAGRFLLAGPVTTSGGVHGKRGLSEDDRLANDRGYTAQPPDAVIAKKAVIALPEELNAGPTGVSNATHKLDADIAR